MNYLFSSDHATRATVTSIEMDAPSLIVNEGKRLHLTC